jgi:amino acid transporter
VTGTDLGGDSASKRRLESLGYSEQLQRSMSLADVVVYGLIYMCPLAPVLVFGFIYDLSGGLVAMVYIVAAVAMYFSAVSYSEMAKEFPIAGSVYSYVRFGTNEFLGFLSGWAILLDYLLMPALLFIFASVAMHLQVPSVPQWVWVPVFVGIATMVNLRGITFTARMNLLGLYIQLAVLAIFALAVGVAWWHGRVHWGIDPFYRKGVFSISRIFSAIPIAALSYIGFDAISTLNEEAKGGGRTVSKATMIVLVAVAALFVAQVYLAALFVPAGTTFGHGASETAFYDISILAVGSWFKVVITMTTAVIAMLSNAFASQAITSRLIFSMARDGHLPAFLAVVDANRKIPVRAIALVAVLSTVIGILAVSKSDLVTSLVTFGSLTAYLLLHVAVMRHFSSAGARPAVFKHWISPIVGIVILAYALWSATVEAKTLAGIWLAVGLIGQRALRMLSGAPAASPVPPPTSSPMSAPMPAPGESRPG